MTEADILSRSGRYCWTDDPSPSRPRTRTALAVAITVALSACTLTARAPASEDGSGPTTEMSWVATARQRGIVGYRDPVGALSPDGSLIAYAEGRDVRVVPVGGGASRTMPRADGQVRHLAWLDDHSFLAEDRAGAVRWWLYDVDTAARAPLWDRPTVTAEGSGREIALDQLASLAASWDGSSVAGIASTEAGWELWQVDRTGEHAEVTELGEDRVLWPAFTPGGEVACIIRGRGHDRLHLPCAGSAVVLRPDLDVVGPVVFDPSGATVYFAAPDGTGMVDLMSADVASDSVKRLAGFARDTYGPSVTATGDRILFRSQSYRTFLAEVDIASGAHRQLTLFQSETPSYSPDGTLVGFTFGTWRRQLDDVNYPDIAQDIGIIRSGAGHGAASEPLEVVAHSRSEDQAMDWSPNGRWIALHSHRAGSDDIWLRPRDGSAPDRRLTRLGRGAEVGWPRWSPDGRTVLFTGESPATGTDVMFTIGVDQESGEVTTDLTEVAVDGLQAAVTHAEWLPDSRTVVAIGKEGPGRQALFTVSATGGTARVFHRFDSEHDYPGLAVRRNGREVAFIAPAPDGHFQVFRMPVGGGPVTQVTSDPVDKSQPAWSPDGSTLAYTVWDYRSQFWLLPLE